MKSKASSDGDIILWITPFLPFPPVSGGRIAIYNKMKLLSSHGYNIVLHSVIEKGDEKYLNSVPEFVCEFNYYYRKKAVSSIAESIVKARPFQQVSRISTKLIESVDESIKRAKIVFIEFDYMISILNEINLEKDTRVYAFIHGDGVVALSNMSEKISRYRPLRYLIKIETILKRKQEKRDLCRNFITKYIFLSYEEMEVMTKRYALHENKVVHIDIPLDLEAYRKKYRESDKGNRIALFTGSMTSNANVMSVKWYLENVHERVKAVYPDYYFFIVGRALDRLGDIEDESVKVFSNVIDISKFFNRATICVLPQISGAGVKLKLLEAVAYKKPIVTTPIGVEGTPFIDREDLLVAETKSQEFSTKVIEVLGDHSNREIMSKRAYEKLNLTYSYESIWEKFEKEL